jgi:hypothetical protein
MPGKPKGTVRGHKITAAQQKLFGVARGIQKGEVSKSYSSQAAKIAKSESAADLHKMAQKPRGGFRKK